MGKTAEDSSNRDSWKAPCRQEALRFFTYLDEEGLASLEEAMIPIQYKEDDLIFQEGAYASGIYLVCQGLVIYGAYTEGGKKRHIVKLAGAGEIFGEEELFLKDYSSRFGYAKALVDTEVVFVERRAFLGLLEREPSIFLDLCERLVREIILLEYKLTCTACKTIEGNIALLLLALGSKYGVRDDKGLQIDLELRRATLMEILGISRESLMRALRKLTQRGIILCQDRRITILDEDRLKSLAEPLPAYLEGKLL